jgi:hypothetical protein
LEFLLREAKERARREAKVQFGFGDVWTWVAIDAESKLIPTWAWSDGGMRERRIALDGGFGGTLEPPDST